MPINRILLVFGLLGILGFGWYYQARQQDQLLASIPTEEQFALARSRAARPIGKPVDNGASEGSSGTGSTANSVGGASPLSQPDGSITPIPEEPETEVPVEVAVLNKAASDQALRLFLALVGSNFEPPFPLDTYSISSIGTSVVKFRATSLDGSQSLTVLVPARGTKPDLIGAYTRDLEITNDQLKSATQGALTLIQIVDPEGGHLIAETTSPRGLTYAIAWTRLGTVFNSEDLANFRTRIGR